jgi:hypothetical protein
LENKQIASLNETAIPTVVINFDEYDPRSIDVWENFISLNDEKERATQIILDANSPFLIESEKGQGKTLLIHTICKENNIALIEEQVGPGTRKTDLFGSKEINTDGTLFNLGIFPRAIEVANHFGHACLYCDEGNTQDPETQKLWNRICDDRKSVFINGKNYKLNPNCKLSIVWTTNPASYVGINSMPEDLRSRFIGEIWKYPTPSQIKKVIDWEKIYINCNNQNVSNGYSQSSQNQVAIPISHEIKELVNDRIFPGLITFIKDIHALRMKGDVEYSLSIRDVNQFFNQFFKNHFDPNSKDPLEQTFSQTVLFKFEDPAERELIKVRIQDTFGVKLK